jgi:hypothetical protein
MRFLGSEAGIEMAGEEVSNAVVLFLSKVSIIRWLLFLILPKEDRKLAQN